MSGTLKQISQCEVCGNTHLTPALDLGLHPMCDDLVALHDDRQCREYPIEILYCDNCRTAHQRYQIPKQELFPPSYHYRSRQTADVLDGMALFTEACAAFLGSLSGTKVLDIGCNDGSLLSKFRNTGATTFGIEPTAAAADAAAAGHAVLQAFLDEALAARFVARYGQPDIITMTNVFAHIEDLQAVLRSLQILCHPATIIVIENHYLGAVIAKRQFDTFYHEHPRTYSYRSFSVIADTLRMSIGRAQFPARYGGNIRVFLCPDPQASRRHDNWAELDTAERDFGAALARLGEDIEVWRGNKLRQLRDAVGTSGPLRAKAFPGRSAIPARLLQLDETLVSAVHEKPGSAKIGHYVPGTRIPILSDDDFVADAEAGPLLNLAWHIKAEITAYMRARGYHGPMIDIIAEADFER